MIEAVSVSVSRGARQVLHDVSFTVPAGRCLAVVGPNGSGKSTLLAALSGDLSFTGRLRVAKESVSAQQSRRRAVMTQQTGVAFGFTVREVVAMARAPWRGHASDAEDAQAIAQAVERADIGHLLDRVVQGLSGGEQARVAFARLLAQTTPVLMLDEPTAALDLKHQVDVLTTLRGEVAKGATVAIVLHDLTLAAAVADYVLLLDQGRVAAFGPPEQVLVPEILTGVYRVPVETLAEGRIIVPSAWV